MEVFFRKLLEHPLYILRHFVLSKKSILSLKYALLNEYVNTYQLQALINPSVHQWILDNKSRYEKMVLVSASPDFFVKQMLAEYPFFDAVHGSLKINLKGKAKLNFIKQQYGSQFDYMGDSAADRLIFAEACRAYKVAGKKISVID